MHVSARNRPPLDIPTPPGHDAIPPEVMLAMMTPRPDSPAAAPRLSVLLVEDSLVQRQFAAAVLQQRHCAVQLARNGVEALDAMASRSFDLVLLDIDLPVLDGLGAVTAIRQRERAAGVRTRVVALTATADRAACLDAGMDEVLAKPLKLSDVDRLLRELISG